RSEVLEHIWNQDDTWPSPLCRVFILQWASMLENKKKLMQSDGWPEMDEGKQPDLINGQDLEQAKAVIVNWIKDLRAQPEVGSLNMQINLSVILDFQHKSCAF
ncbi:hypothetical protein CHARACLAT_032965, partial [Characodon lateralis]|nr:hypothetical protein [Characodon lateralis]